MRNIQACSPHLFCALIHPSWSSVHSEELVVATNPSAQIAIYRASFNCDDRIIANAKKKLSSQELERNHALRSMHTRNMHTQ